MHASWTVTTIPLIIPGADEVVEVDGDVGDTPAIEEDDAGLNYYWNSHAIAHFHTYFSIY